MRNKRSFFALLLTLSTVMTSCKKTEDYTYPGPNFREGKIVYVNGKEYKYKDIYKLFDGKKESASAYFSIAKSILTQLVTERTSAMKTIVDDKMEDYRDQWNTNAKNNNTSYEEEKKKTLSSEGVLDEAALENKLYVNQQTTENENNYFKDNPGADDYTYYISEDVTKKFVTDNLPYHVSHILVKVDASSDGEGLSNGKISADNATKIGTTIKNLISSDSFGSVAQQLSDDSGSAKTYGELADSSNGVAMEKRTSYINEFKLGIYAYDAFVNKNTGSGTNTTLKKSLRVPGQELDDGSQDTSVSNEIADTSIYKKQVFGIPLSVALTMSYVASKDKADSGSKPTNASENQYPRNIYFNNYFNQHSVSFIYNDADEYKANFLADIKATYGNDDTYKDIAYVSKADATSAGGDANKSVEALLPTRYEEYKSIQETLDTYIGSKDKRTDAYSKKFKSFTEVAAADAKLVSYKGSYQKNSAKDEYYATNKVTALDTSNKDILTDERGNPIIVVRGGSDSYQGIHFITVNKDPFNNTGIDENNYKYWSITIPDSSKTGAAYSTDYSTNPSFINFVNDSSSQKTTYKDRATMIRNDIKAANSSLQTYDLWEYNLQKYKEKYNVDFLELLGDKKNTIVSYVNSSKKGTISSSSDTLDSSWESYIKKLTYDENIAKPRDMIPTVCIGYFNRGSYSIKTKDPNDTSKTVDTYIGGACHVSK